MASTPERHSTEFLKQLQYTRAAASNRDEQKRTTTIVIVVAVVIGLLLPPLMPLVIVGIIWYLNQNKGSEKQKRETTAPQKSWPLPLKHRKETEQHTFRVSSTFSTNEDGEVWMSREKQLEQLKVLRDAGLLEEEEYRMKKERIQNG